MGHGTGRRIGLVGISLGVLFILFTIAFISCMKRKKTVLTDHMYPHPSIDTQVRVTLGTARATREEDIPPAYSLVVTVKEDEDQDLPTYLEAVGGGVERAGGNEGSEHNRNSSDNPGAIDLHDHCR